MVIAGAVAVTRGPHHMTLVNIDIIHTEYGKPGGTACLNPEYVVAVARPRKNPDSWTHIYLDRRDKEGNRLVVVTAVDLQTVLATFGPFIEIRRQEIIAADNWPVWHVRPDAIVAMTPTADGRGTVYLKDGSKLRVDDPSVVAPLVRRAA